MGSLSNPKTWIPYMDSKDCSQGFCSLYCPQWCYIIFPPPPPIQFPDQNSTPTFSPLVIAIIAILASAFLLVSYYTIISKYCGNRDSSPRSENFGPNSGFTDGHNSSANEPLHGADSGGLDEALIKSITVCKYKKGDGLVEGTDCSVCLSEFEEDESLRLLPKCSHAFHLQCIDTWLKSHSNCPLCRANIASFNTSQSQPPPPPTETDLINESPPQIQPRNENVAAIAEDLETGGREVEMAQNHAVPKNPFRAFSDLGDSEERGAVIEIRDEALQPIRRSFSMDFSLQEREFPGVAGPSKRQPAGDEVRKSVGSHRKGVLNSVTGAVAMTRSFSSGRLMMFMGHGPHGRVRNAFIPV